METRVAALLTILDSLLAVYQVNCFLIVLNITTFQRRRVVLSRAMDSSLGSIRRSFVQRRLSFVKSLYTQSTIVLCTIVVHSINNCPLYNRRPLYNGTIYGDPLYNDDCPLYNRRQVICASRAWEKIS